MTEVRFRYVPPQKRGAAQLTTTAAAFTREEKKCTTSASASVFNQLEELLECCVQELQKQIKQRESIHKTEVSKADDIQLQRLRKRAATLGTYPLGNVQVTAVGAHY
jgi:hypothetical protein